MFDSFLILSAYIFFLICVGLLKYLCNADLVTIIFCSLCLSWKVFFYSFSFAGYSNQGDSYCLSWFEIHHSMSFWPLEFLQRIIQLFLFGCSFLIFFAFSVLSIFYCDVRWFSSVFAIWDSKWLLSLYIFPKIWKVFCDYVIELMFYAISLNLSTSFTPKLNHVREFMDVCSWTVFLTLWLGPKVDLVLVFFLVLVLFLSSQLNFKWYCIKFSLFKGYQISFLNLLSFQFSIFRYIQELYFNCSC